jgi:bifunctional lysine-specific demethylase and histidyl-hydroxylase NO66
VSLDTAERVRAGRGALARCAPDPDAFLDRIWGRRAAVHEASDDASFDDLLALDDVDRFLTSTALRTPFFRLVKAGERIPEAAYTRTGRTGSRDVAGIADPARVAALFEDGATIVLQGLHRWSEPVARFCRDLELELGHPCQVNAYVTPRGAQGLDLHDDPHDVFVLQTFGRKRWEIHAAPNEAPRDPIHTELASGGTIYLPTGTPHAARAQDDLSGHLTVGVHVTPWRDILRSVVDAVLADDDDRVPAGWTGDPSGLAGDLRGRITALADRLRDVDELEEVERRRDRFFSVRPQLAGGTIAERSAPIEVDDRTVVRRRSGSVCELRVADGALVALLGDRRLEMPAWVEPAMRTIADLGGSEPLVVGDLTPDLGSASARAVLVRRLIREGLLTARDG